MILSIAHTKGGVGKTTTAIQLATYLRVVKNIEDVLLIDADSQHSSQNAITRRNTNPDIISKDLKLNCEFFKTSDNLLAQIDLRKKNHKYIIIDIGARNSDMFRASLNISNAVLIPFQPQAFSIEAFLDEFLPLYKDAKRLGPVCKLFGFINFAEAQGSANDETKEYLGNLEDIEYLDCCVGKRKSILVSTSFGRSVFEEKPKDQKACAEIENLANCLFM